MSVIVYGGDTVGSGITLSYVRTRRIDFTPVKSDDGMSYRHTSIRFDVSAIVDEHANPWIMGENVTQTLARIQHYLNLPRKAFQYSVGGNPLVTWTGGPDLMQGPTPFGVRVREVCGTGSYSVDFGIELNIVTCPDGANPLWTSHRWQEEVTMDQEAMTTKTRRGRITSRVDMFVNPDALRYLIVPPMEPGFIRTGSRYVLQSDGLALEYEVTDAEMYLLPPDPAWKAEGEWIESSPNGASRNGEVRIRFRGAKTEDKGKLIQKAVQVAIAKMDAADIQRDPKSNSFIAISAIQEKLWENEIEVRVKALLKPLTDRVDGVPFKLDRFTTFPLDSTQGVPGKDPGTRGSAGLKLIAAALGDPCLSQTALRSGGGEPSTPTLRGTAPEAVVTLAPVLPDDQSSLHTDNDPGIYTAYRVAMKSQQDQNMLVLPVAKKDALPAVIQLAAAYQTRVAEWKCEKVGAPPKLPDPDLKDTNFVLSKVIIDTDEVQPYGDGVSMIYRVAGRYEYIVKDLKKASLISALPPWVNESARNEKLRAAGTFAPGIIDGTNGGGATLKTDGTVTPYSGGGFTTGGGGGITPGVNG